MGQELTRVPCPECGTHGEAPDPEASRWQCSSCGNGFFLRRCSACARVSYVDGLQGFHSPWPCMWCGQFNRGFNQNMDPAAASVAELAVELAGFGADRSDPAEAEDGDSVEAEPSSAVDAAADPGPVPVTDLGSPPWSTRGQHRLAVIVAVVAVGVAAGVLAVAGGHAATGEFAGLASHSGGTQAVQAGTQTVQSETRAVQVTASQVGTADIQGVPGQLTIVGVDTGNVRLTGELNWTGHAPVVQTRLDRATGVLEVSIRCASASPCTENLQLEVPADTATTLRQPAGRVVATGLAGPLRITAGNVNISASGLRSPELTALIRSGQLSATFSSPPRRVSVTLASAQATLRLPSEVGYRITQKVASGHIGIAIPQASSATRSVTACLHSSELELLPS